MPVTSSEIGEARPTSAPPATERPVFAAPSARRRRLLHAAGVGAFGLAAAWLIALVLGSFGFDALPGFTLPGEPDRADAPSGAVAGARESATRTHEGGDAGSATRVARAITRSARAGAATDNGTKRTSRTRRSSGHRRSGSSGGAAATTPGTPATSSPGASASAGTPAAQAPAATPTASQGTGRGRPESPGDRRSATAGTGGNSGTTTAAPATTTTTTESPGRSGSAPGRTR